MPEDISWRDICTYRNSSRRREEQSLMKRGIIPLGERNCPSRKEELSQLERGKKKKVPVGQRNSLSRKEEQSQLERGIVPYVKRNSLSCRAVVRFGGRKRFSCRKGQSQLEGKLVPAANSSSPTGGTKVFSSLSVYFIKLSTTNYCTHISINITPHLPLKVVMGLIICIQDKMGSTLGGDKLL